MMKEMINNETDVNKFRKVDDVTSVLTNFKPIASSLTRSINSANSILVCTLVPCEKYLVQPHPHLGERYLNLFP